MNRFQRPAPFALAVASWGVLACQSQPSAPPPQTAAYPGQPAGYPGYAPAPGYPSPPVGPAYAPGPAYPPSYGGATPYPPRYPQAVPPAPPTAPGPPPGPQSAPPSSSPASYPLGPLIGAAAWQAEVRAVARELVANLSPEYQARVAAVPIVFDPNPNDVNAYASCDDHDAPFVAGTEGLLDAIDAIAETRATDELFGTHTYDQYASLVVPRLVTQGGGSALLPPGLIPAAYWSDPRRVTRAHQIFDETAAFTFGHELSHHYLGHTGCAMGQASALGQAVAQLGQFLTSGAPPMNQPNEAFADSYGCRNTLDTGLARSATAYRWTEGGGLLLLDFFDRLMRASGAGPLVSILLSHPAPQVRISLVQTVAAAWRLQHPGVR